jgi:two-component system chemotaxis response regulator CheB
VGAVLTGMGSDGAKGLKLLREAGCDTFAQDRKTALVAEAPTAAIELDAASREVALDELATAMIGCCNIG